VNLPSTAERRPHSSGSCVCSKTKNNKVYRKASVSEAFKFHGSKREDPKFAHTISTDELCKNAKYRLLFVLLLLHHKRHIVTSYIHRHIHNVIRKSSHRNVIRTAIFFIAPVSAIRVSVAPPSGQHAFAVGALPLCVVTSLSGCKQIVSVAVTQPF